MTKKRKTHARSLSNLEPRKNEIEKSAKQKPFNGKDPTEQRENPRPPPGPPHPAKPISPEMVPKPTRYGFRFLLNSFACSILRLSLSRPDQFQPEKPLSKDLLPPQKKGGGKNCH